jgi:hypothetical protein
MFAHLTTETGTKYQCDHTAYCFFCDNKTKSDNTNDGEEDDYQVHPPLPLLPPTNSILPPHRPRRIVTIIIIAVTLSPSSSACYR